jgi:hypothetical protein
MDKLKIRFNVWRMLMDVCSINSDISSKIEEIKKCRNSFQIKKDEVYKYHVHTPQK